MIKPTNVDEYLAHGCGRCKLRNTPECKAVRWQTELSVLREIIQSFTLEETIKWSQPVYMYKGQNILILTSLKDSVVVSFLRGVELNDPKQILEKPGENSRFARYFRISSMQTLNQSTAQLRHFIASAIELEQNKPKSLQTKSAPKIEYPEALIEQFQLDESFADAFQALTPGRQRSHILHYNAAKQLKTKVSRIEKSKQKVLQGKGWNER
jgi:uncharacterized protein YdeI (YjbR/CyaY-like superfamily)